MSATIIQLHTEPPVRREKREQTLRARLALVGVCMHIGQNDRGAPAYILSRGAETRETCSLEVIEELLEEMGG